jgi:hypothetical protein
VGQISDPVVGDAPHHAPARHDLVRNLLH